VSIEWTASYVDGIIEAWYPGEEGGNAVADVIFGNYNPAGRLPFTFYRNLGQLPDYLNMSFMAPPGRTYRYFTGNPLWPFGFGLSYTTFQYSSLSVPSVINVCDPLYVSVNIKNNGTRSGDEVVQVYITLLNPSYISPNFQLVGFKRINLRVNEVDNISFTIKPYWLATVLKDGSRVVEPMAVNIAIGGGQPKFTNNKVVSIFKMVGNATPADLC